MWQRRQLIPVRERIIHIKKLHKTTGIKRHYFDTSRCKVVRNVITCLRFKDESRSTVLRSSFEES